MTFMMQGLEELAARSQDPNAVECDKPNPKSPYWVEDGYRYGVPKVLLC
jgi:hypothetical protein